MTKKLVYFNALLALVIILWGAWVRLSGSGAGCGDHWPLCNGEVIPNSSDMKTFIEFFHRLTSGIFGLSVLAQLIFAIKEYGTRHWVRVSSWLLLVLSLIEALIGAVLVKKSLVLDNQSTMRAWVIGAHLINTMLLMGSIVMSYFYLNTSGSQPRLKNDKKGAKYIAFIGVILFLLTSSFGAITALGNTLFPSESLSQGMIDNFNTNSHFLIRLRLYHPVLSVIMGIYWIVVASIWSSIDKNVASSAGVVNILVMISLAFGAINYFMMAPHWGALLHLALANFLWISIVYLILERFNRRT